MQEAAIYVDAESIPAVLNTPFTIMKSLDVESLSAKEYMSNEKARSLFNIRQTYSSKDSITNENVVVIILESFSAEYIGYLNGNKGFTPFLDSLSKYSLTCINAFANSKRSIEGIPSVVASFPQLMEEPFITSPYNVNKINSIASVLKGKGYKSYFFHGGNNGTIGFDGFSKIAGYTEYYGRDEYDGDKKDFDGSWGIFDDRYYQFMIRKLNISSTPFVSTFFSLSSHDPYEIPAYFKDKFPKGNQRIHESIGYADHSLKLFFDEAKKQPWYKNTLFVITADHTGPSIDPFYGNRFGQLKIPILYFRPDNSLIEINKTVTQQVDIVPTVLDLIHYIGSYTSFGQSIFSKNEHWNISYSNGIWQLITKTYLIQYNGNNTSGLYNTSVDSLLQNNLIANEPTKASKYQPLIESILQQYRLGLINNSLLDN